MWLRVLLGFSVLWVYLDRLGLCEFDFGELLELDAVVLSDLVYLPLQHFFCSVGS